MAVDIFLVLLLILSTIGGYRRGVVLQGFGLLGVLLGIALGAWIAPPLSALADGALARVTIALSIVVIGAVIGNAIGWVVGTRVRKRVPDGAGRRTDAGLGAGMSAIAMLLTTWFIALNLAGGPFPAVARSIQESRIVRALDAVLPAPPALLTSIEEAANLLGVPDAFAGLPPLPADPVPEPLPVDARSAERAAIQSTVQVLASGCQPGVLSEGTGFVVTRTYVITAAHVVAGADDLLVQTPSARLPAALVGYDPELDAAVLWVPELAAQALPIATEEAPRGAGGAILGFPAGGYRATPAAVRAVIDAEGRDIYREGLVTRRLYEVQAEVGAGTSGGPFVLADGRVAGMVIATSTIDPAVAYALTGASLTPLIASSTATTAATDPGACLS